MEWVFKLLALFKRNSAAEYKTIIEGWKGLNEGYISRVQFLETRLKEVDQMPKQNLNDDQVHELLEREKTYLRQLIQLTEEKRVLEEEIIFLKILKNGNKS